MGTDVSRTEYEGILIMDPSITAVWATESNATESTPQAGPITPDTGVKTEIVLQSSGTPTDGDPLLLYTMKAGVPGVDTAGFAWRETTATDWYGWDVPSSITGVELIQHEGVSSTGASHPCVIDMLDGRILMVYTDFDATNRTVRRRVRGIDGVWAASAGLLVVAKNGRGDMLHPQALLLPSGRVLLFHLTTDNTNSQGQIRMMYTDDITDTTWKEGAVGVLPAPLSLVQGGSGTSFDRLRVAYSPVTGQIVMTVEITTLTGPTTEQTQYASRDLGASFTSVGSGVANGASGGAHALVWSAGTFFLFYLTGGLIKVRRIGSAYSAFSDATQEGPTVTVVTSATGISAIASEDGTLYAWGGNATVGFTVSRDHGASWVEGFDAGVQWAGQGVLATSHCVCWNQGRAFMVSTQSGPAARVNSLTGYILGGYSSVTLPPEAIAQNVGRQMWFWDGWCAQHDTIATAGVPFTDNSTGTPVYTHDANDGSENITTGVGANAFHDHTDTADAAYPEVILRASFTNNSGTMELSARSAESTTPQSTQAGARLTATQLSLRESSDGSLIGSAVAVTAGVRIDALLAVNGTNATLWYRTHTNEGPRLWIQVATTTGLVETAGSTTSRVRVNTSVSTNIDMWDIHYTIEKSVVVTSAVAAGRSLAAGFTNPDHLFARGLPAGDPAWVNDGVSIRGTDGPTYRGETFSMEVTHPNPVEYVIPTVSRSPRLGWVGADAAADTTIAFQMDTFDDTPQDQSIGVYLGSCNVEHVRLQAYRNDAWVNVDDIDRTQSGLRFTRNGCRITPGVSGAAGNSRYYHRNELKGSYFEFDNGDVRGILGNTEGHWDETATNNKSVIVRLDPADCDDGEDASGTAGIIVFANTMTVHHGSPHGDAEGYRLLLNRTGSGGAAPPGAKFKIGAAVIGPLVVFGKRTDRAYSLVRSSQVQTTQLPDGTLSKRKVGPTRRRLTINFADGRDVSTARGSADGDFIKGSTSASTLPIAHAFDTPLQLQGLLDQLDGSLVPCVYVPRIPAGPSDTVTATTGLAGGAIYGHLADTMRIDAVLGQPQETEVFRGPQFVFTEEV
jgi:hypothetical protein